jgi:Transketolase, C-terminal subunit
MQLSDKNIISDMRTAYGKALVELGSKDPNIVCVGADTTDSLKTNYSEINSLPGYTMSG